MPNTIECVRMCMYICMHVYLRSITYYIYIVYHIRILHPAFAEALGQIFYHTPFSIHHIPYSVFIYIYTIYIYTPYQDPTSYRQPRLLARSSTIDRGVALSRASASKASSAARETASGCTYQMEGYLRGYIGILRTLISEIRLLLGL